MTSLVAAVTLVILLRARAATFILFGDWIVKLECRLTWFFHRQFVIPELFSVHLANGSGGCFGRLISDECVMPFQVDVHDCSEVVKHLAQLLV